MALKFWYRLEAENRIFSNSHWDGTMCLVHPTRQTQSVVHSGSVEPSRTPLRDMFLANAHIVFFLLVPALA